MHYLLLFLSVWASLATADCWILRKLGRSLPLDTTTSEYQKDERLEQVELILSRVSGRHLTATQHYLASLPSKIDTFLFIGNIKPLKNTQNGWIRRFEFNFIKWERNKEKLTALEAFWERSEALKASPRPNFDNPLEWTGQFHALRDELFQWLKESGLLTLSEEKHPNFTNWSRKQVQSLIESKISFLEKDTVKLEKQIGLRADEYLAVRGHLHTLISGGLPNLIRLIANLDQQDSTRIEIPQVGSPILGKPISVLNLNGVDSIDVKQRMVDETVKKISEDIPRISAWILKGESLEENELKELQDFLNESQYINEDLEGAIAGYSADKKRLPSALRLLRRRLEDTRVLTVNALALDRGLGLFQEDFVKHPAALGSVTYRPDLEAVKQFSRRSVVARKAQTWRDIRRELYTWMDSILFYGWLGQKVHSFAKASNTLSLNFSHFPEKAIMGLFRGMYNEYVSKQYYPALNLLKHSGGKDGAKLADILELLNAGSNDELLLTFARRTDMKEIWNYISIDAKNKADRDPAELYERMKKAQAKVKELELGTLGPITESSRARYIMGTTADIVLIAFLRHLSGLSFADFAEEEPEEEESADGDAMEEQEMPAERDDREFGAAP